MYSVVLKIRRSFFAMLLVKTTNSQQVFPSCSSRTKVSLKQFSFIYGRQGQTVSRRSKPNSRTTLFGEQTNPWDLLQPQDVMSRHRGAKQLHRYELLRVISLLSPAYLLSVERWPFHNGPPDHYNRLASLLDMSVLQSGKHMLLRSTADLFPA